MLINRRLFHHVSPQTPNVTTVIILVGSLSDIGVLEGVTKIQRGGERRREDQQPLMQETGYNSD